MKQKEKITVRKVESDAYEIRFSQSKIEMENKAKTWKMQASSLSGFYSLIQDKSDKDINIITEILYKICEYITVPAMVSCSDITSHTIEAILHGADFSKEKLEEILEEHNKIWNSTILDIIEKRDAFIGKNAKPSEDSEEEALEDVKNMERFKAEVKVEDEGC